MANATISAPAQTQRGNFNLGVSFDAIIMGLEKADFTLRAITENGITGIDFSIVGTEPTANFNLPFTVPSNVEGSLEVSITGMVTRQGSSTPEAVMSNRVTVYYDTTSDVTVTFGTVEYRDGGGIAVPVTFGEAVIAPSKSIFQLRKVSGDELTGVEYVLLGSGTVFELVFTIPADRSGSFRIAAEGDVLKSATGVWDNVIATPMTINYSTVVPRIVDWDIPATYTPEQKFDVKFAFNVVVTGLHLNNVQDVFLLEGAYLGTPDAYKWIGSGEPNLQANVPDTIPTTDWELLAAPPPGDPTPGMNGFNDDGMQWHGVELQYLLVRFANISTGITGAFNMTLREGYLRGPIS